MTIQEFRRMGAGELQKQLASLREQLRTMRFRTYAKEVKNNHLMKALRKDIARILTVLNSAK